MKKMYYLLFFLSISFFGFSQNVTITKVFDTECSSASGGLIRTTELYVDGTVDFDNVSVEIQTNSNTTWSSSDWTSLDITTLGTSGVVTDEFIYLVRSVSAMELDFPSTTFNTANTLLVGFSSSGDDRLRVLLNGVVVSQFGETDTDGSGTAWDHIDGVASRKANNVDLGTFDISHWEFSAINYLDGKGKCSDSESGQVTLEAAFTALGASFSLSSGSGWTPSCLMILGNTSATCNATTDGPANDTYDATIAFTGGNAGHAFVIASTSGTVGGDNPASVSVGSITISGIAEGTDITVTTNDTAAGGNCDLSIVIESPSCINLVVNEVLYDPAGDLTGDANGDGTRDAFDDEFIEFINNSPTSLDITGYTVSDNTAVRHIFPATTIPGYGFVVLFGGGTPTGTFSGAIVQKASEGAVDEGTLSLSNGGEIITLKNASGAVVALLDYGTEGTNLGSAIDQSITRSPDATGAFVTHTTANASLLFSPGQTFNGIVLSMNGLEIDGLGVYPNPVSISTGFINVTSATNEAMTVVLFDVLGQQITKQTVSENRVNISNLKSGVYFMKISQGSKTSVEKIVVNN